MLKQRGKMKNSRMIVIVGTEICSIFAVCNKKYERN